MTFSSIANTNSLSGIYVQGSGIWLKEIQSGRPASPIRFLLLTPQMAGS
jgi:hypothetical protein